MGGQELLLSFGGLEQRCCFLSQSPLSLGVVTLCCPQTCPFPGHRGDLGTAVIAWGWAERCGLPGLLREWWSLHMWFGSSAANSLCPACLSDLASNSPMTTQTCISHYFLVSTLTTHPGPLLLQPFSYQCWPKRWRTCLSCPTGKVRAPTSLLVFSSNSP